MSGVEVVFSLDEQTGVVLIDYTDAVIDSEAAFAEWTDKLMTGFETMKRRLGGKYPLAVCIDGLSLTRRFGERYSKELAVPVAERYASAIARYGTSGKTTAVIAIEAMKRVLEHEAHSDEEAFQANVFANRSEAIAFLRQVAG